MRKVVFILFLSIAGVVEADSTETLICFSLDWQLSIRGGIEHRFNSRIGLKSDLGIGVPGIIVADAFLVVYLLPENSRWQVNICAGVPNAGVPLGSSAAMVSLGGSLLVRRSITERMSMDLRLGEGFPLFFEKDEDIIRDIHFPLNLWPDIALGMCFKI